MKNTFFKDQKKQHIANIDLRKAAIEKVETITKAGGDLKGKRNEIIQIQKDWKTLGHVPKKQGDELWNTFRKVCNEFLKMGEKYIQ